LYFNKPYPPAAAIYTRCSDVNCSYFALFLDRSLADLQKTIESRSGPVVDVGEKSKRVREFAV
jgi:hypothetical protein